MTTPYQGPGMWEQGNRDQALDWLANLDSRQQQALQRAMNTHQALGPIYNAAARVQQVSVQTYDRLSEGAQALAGQARQFGRDTVERAGQARDNAVNRVTEFGQNTAERIGQARDFAVSGAQTAVGAVGNAGRAVADGTRQTAGKVSRWFQERRSDANNRANAARAAFAAFRQDPTLAQTNMNGKDIQALSAHAQALVSAQTPEARAAAAQQLVQAASTLQTSNSPQAGDRDLVNKFANEGLAPAGTIPAQYGPQQNSPQGQAPQTGAQTQTQTHKGPDLTR